MPSRQERRKAERDASKRAPTRAGTAGAGAAAGAGSAARAGAAAGAARAAGAAGAAGAAAALAHLSVDPGGDWTTQAADPNVLFHALGRG